MHVSPHSHARKNRYLGVFFIDIGNCTYMYIQGYYYVVVVASSHVIMSLMQR